MVRLRASAGSILVVVLITLLFSTMALVAFMEKAENDLAVAARDTVGDRLRMEAYSAVETTLAVLADFVTADQGLHSTGEGWGDPLGWAGYTPGNGHTVDVAFLDESGKIPLIHATSTTLMNLFQSASWNMQQPDAQRLTDVIMSWMQKAYIPATPFTPDYEQAALPYDPPQRALRSFDELAAIDYAREVFYDTNGRPNALWWAFTNDFSVFNYLRPDINGANQDVLGAVGQFDQNQQRNISDFLTGSGQYSAMGPQSITNLNELGPIVGAGGNASAAGNTVVFDSVIHALRILVTVHEGRNQFRLSVVVSPPAGGATTVMTTATDGRKGTPTGPKGGESNQGANLQGQALNAAAPSAAQQAAANAQNIQYPFTILEILENDQIPTPPPPAPVPTS